eukprot:1195373-Prorocentrum_minimum.AAC.6
MITNESEALCLSWSIHASHASKSLLKRYSLTFQQSALGSTVANSEPVACCVWLGGAPEHQDEGAAAHQHGAEDGVHHREGGGAEAAGGRPEAGGGADHGAGIVAEAVGGEPLAGGAPRGGGPGAGRGAAVPPGNHPEATL